MNTNCERCQVLVAAAGAGNQLWVSTWGEMQDEVLPYPQYFSRVILKAGLTFWRPQGCLNNAVCLFGFLWSQINWVICEVGVKVQQEAEVVARSIGTWAGRTGEKWKEGITVPILQMMNWGPRKQQQAEAHKGQRSETCLSVHGGWVARLTPSWERPNLQNTARGWKAAASSSASTATKCMGFEVLGANRWHRGADPVHIQTPLWTSKWANSSGVSVKIKMNDACVLCSVIFLTFAMNVHLFVCKNNHAKGNSQKYALEWSFITKGLT